MAAEYPQRYYRMTDAELGMFVSNLCITLTRDLTDLTVFGVTAPKIAALKALGDAFEVFTTDSVALANIIGATEEKNTTVESLKEGIRNMALRCQIKWGVKSHQEKSLDITGFNDLNNKEILTVARRVHEQMTLYLPDLSALGLTEDVLDDFQDLIELSETKLNEQITQINTRDIMTKDRILKGNELYTEAVNYCNIGKRVYAMTDPARYNDYLIYDSFTPGSLTAPENLSVDVGTMVFSCDPVPNAVSYQFEMAVAGSPEFEVIYSGPDNYFSYTPPASGLRQYRARCHNSGGYSDYSGVMMYNYHGVSVGIPQNLTFNSSTHLCSWDAVEGAVSYQAEILFDAPDEEWVNIYTGAANQTVHINGDGTYYLRARAGNGSYGEWSDPIVIGYMNSAPINLVPSVTYGANTQVSLSFNPIGGVPQYKLFVGYGLLGSSTTPVMSESIVVSASPVLVPTTHANERYFMGLKCFDGLDYSLMSDIVSIDVNGLTS